MRAIVMLAAATTSVVINIDRLLACLKHLRKQCLLE